MSAVGRAAVQALFALVICALSAAAFADAPFARGLLFRLERAGTQPSWIFGTIHSSDPRTLVLPAPVEGAFGRARTFAAEVLLTDIDADDFRAMAQLDDGKSLADFFDGDTLTAIRDVIGAPASPSASLDRLKPWAVLLKLAQAPAPAAAGGTTLDASLLAAARAKRMRLIGLELPAEQASAFDAVPLETQIAVVRYLLRERDALAREHAVTVDAWLARDLGRLAAIARAPAGADPATVRHFERLSHELVDNRSVLMAHRLFLPLRHGGVFVAVGALHLYGEHGMLALLHEQGYRVRRLY